MRKLHYVDSVTTSLVTMSLGNSDTIPYALGTFIRQWNSTLAKRYIITNKDFSVANYYLHTKLKGNDGDWLTKDFDTWRKAEKEFRASTTKRPAEALNSWAEKWLNKNQWQNLKDAIRKSRSRMKPENKRVSVELTPMAHRILSDLSDKDGLTLSEFIEKKHKTRWLNR